MSEFTEQEFREAIARLDGWTETSRGYWKSPTVMEDLETYQECTYHFLPDYHNDLNQLMPIAWKYGIEVIIYPDEDADYRMWVAETIKASKNDIEAINSDPVEAIRQCLWAIYQERKDDQNTE